ncbi:hypothetical protein PRZ48_010079 [Zasmidium cellare]|uniref:Uncharacterized protein n=1 Tax=Zasmidium cellare TaxID=395010 RepID=A0ABR0EDI4_ZASCE|nr:hypothetical protein PRZ48_010079 [Zasmidium cellare]
MKTSTLLIGAAISHVATSIATMDPWGSIKTSTPQTCPPRPKYDPCEIIRHMTSIYRILIGLGPLANSSVVFPPPKGNTLDFSHIPSHVDTDPRVVALMEKLPVVTESGMGILPGMEAVNFLDPSQMRLARMVDMRNYDYDLMGGEGAIWGLPTTVTLLRGDHEVVPVLVLDVADNTIRKIGDVEYLEDEYTRHERNQTRLDDHRYDFYNWPAMSAPEYLVEVIIKFLSTTWFPDYSGMVFSLHEWEEEEMIEKRRLLREVYGWPEMFREEDWKREVQKQPEVDMDEVESDWLEESIKNW